MLFAQIRMLLVLHLPLLLMLSRFENLLKIGLNTNGSMLYKILKLMNNMFLYFLQKIVDQIVDD